MSLNKWGSGASGPVTRMRASHDGPRAEPWPSLPAHRAFSLVAMILPWVCGCQTVPTAKVQDFVNAATTLSQAEADYFDQIQAASDASHTLIAGAIYVGGHGPFSTLAPELMKRDDFSKAKAARLAVLNQLKNYTEQLSAITNAAGGTWIADDARSTTTNATKLLADAKLVKLSQAEAGILQTAVQSLESAIVSSETVGELKSLAAEASQPIAQIAQMVKADNENIEITQYASGLGEDQNVAMMSMLHFVYDDKRVNAAERLQALQAWRTWKPDLVDKSKAIQDAVDKLQKANEALAANQDVSAHALAAQALSFAQTALGTAPPAASSGSAAGAAAVK